MDPETAITKRYNKEEYILSFSAQGVSVFVTDIHRDVYIDLKALFIIDKGLFKQYFTKGAFRQALDNGLNFYSNRASFSHFQTELTEHCKQFNMFFETNIKRRKNIDKEALQQFFNYTLKLCKDYTKMNYEYTDKAFTLRDQNEVIKQNLALLIKLKDEVRAFMNMVLFEEQGYSSHLFTILSDQFSIQKAILENLTQQELLELFEEKRPDETRISQRQEIFVTSYDEPHPYEGNLARRIAKNFEEKITTTNQITGQTACQGKVIGKVKIIPVDYGDLTNMNNEIKKMQQGDILVAKTTAPELIIACQKAGAIVTDVGGLLSHAAIISREFGIPCIVGTNNATQILNDGDEVEVDATTGTLRIIKKYSLPKES